HTTLFRSSPTTGTSTRKPSRQRKPSGPVARMCSFAKAQAALRAAGFYARWLPPLAVGKGHVPTAYGEFGSLAPHLRFVERRSRELARSMFYGMSRSRGKTERRQGFLGRVVDIGAELCAMTAGCGRRGVAG